MSAHSRGLGVISKWSMDSPETVVSLSCECRVAIPVLSKIFFGFILGLATSSDLRLGLVFSADRGTSLLQARLFLNQYNLNSFRFFKSLQSEGA